MNEYYKKRYNISNYFLNVDTDDFYNHMTMIILFITITIIIYTIYPIIFIITNKNINPTVLIYIIFLIFIIFNVIVFNINTKIIPFIWADNTFAD